MKERPIKFNADMVRALLEGRKTMTRRVVNDLPPWPITEIVHDAGKTGEWMPNGPAPQGRGMAAGPWRPCPYGQIGDRMWVQEEWGVGSRPDPWGGYDGIEYHADEAYIDEIEDLPCYKVKTPDDICLGDYQSGWMPDREMPRWASRILLEIVSVRVERLQDITEDDARAEGCEASGWIPSYSDPDNAGCHESLSAADAFSELWETIYGSGAWDKNPWVWVVEFKRIEAAY